MAKIACNASVAIMAGSTVSGNSMPNIMIKTDLSHGQLKLLQIMVLIGLKIRL